MEKKIKNYGFVPFPYFQQFILIVEILLIKYSSSIKKYIHKFCMKHLGKKDYYIYMYKFILSIPMFSIIYYDIRYSSFSFTNIGVPDQLGSVINQLLWILGAYGIIQVLAQDSGLRTGTDQRDLVQYTLIFFFVGTGMAYSITQNRSQSMIAMFLYLHLKYIISDNVSNVCFEDLGDTLTDDQINNTIISTDTPR